MPEAPIVTRLEREACLRLLASVPVGRVAVSVRALPAIRTVRFTLTPGHVVFRVSPDSTLRRAATGVVAFQADDYDAAARHGWCVQVVGRSEEVPERHQTEEMAGLSLESWAPPGRGDHLFRVPIGSVTGEWVEWPTPPGATNI